MVKIKGNPGGGHTIFKFARSLAVYDDKTYRVFGSPTREVVADIQAGVVFDLDITNYAREDEKRHREELVGNTRRRRKGREKSSLPDMMPEEKKKILCDTIVALKSPACRVRSIEYVCHDYVISCCAALYLNPFTQCWAG